MTMTPDFAALPKVECMYECCDACGAVAYYLKGWRPPGILIAAVKQDYDVDLVENQVKHKWVRLVPIREEGTVKGMMFYPAKESAKGAFEVTVAYVA